MTVGASFCVCCHLDALRGGRLVRAQEVRFHGPMDVTATCVSNSVPAMGRWGAVAIGLDCLHSFTDERHFG